MMDPTPRSVLNDLYCPVCNHRFDANKLQTFCQTCHSPLLAEYDFDALDPGFTPTLVKNRLAGIWRWAELLPVRSAEYRITLGEGDTPLLKAPRLGSTLGLTDLYIKDEGNNPTGSFKARGLVMAVARALELGVAAFVIPTAGNAGGALAAYAARVSLPAHVFMPADAPNVNQIEVEMTGTPLYLVDGLINDAGRAAAGEAVKYHWFDVSTFKEPYRVEGKKTMGLELAENFTWDLPEVIIYPTGGGTGLVGMWKAFHELQALGWIGEKLPRMVSVQSAGCAPIVRAFEEQADRAAPWENAHTIASGLRVPVAFADRLILEALRESQGTALAVTDEEIHAAEAALAQTEGIFAAPEGAATFAGLKSLVQEGWIQPEERVVLFNTGHGLKYL
jgi:threonine synthase